MEDLGPLLQNSVDLIREEDLAKRLASGKPLRVKLGVDPTRPDLTFGHMVVLNKLRQFQDAGHTAVLIIGDFTTRIGDPSGRSATRPVLTEAEIASNAETYAQQAFQILDEARTEIRYNSEWFGQQSFFDCLSLARKMTVARMLERDDFSKRHTSGTPISLVEFLYPLVQGQDSIEVKADVELGGTDQLFNLLVGRQLQKDAGMPEQIVLTMPLLVGLDGAEKMSKSLGNYVAFTDPAKEMFGKIMSVSDKLMWDWYRLLLLTPAAEIERLKGGHPMQAKKQLAVQLTTRIHGTDTGQRELEAFERVFSRNEVPAEMPEFSWADLAGDPESKLVPLLGATRLFPSNKEIRRLIEQGGVKVDQQPWTDPHGLLKRPSSGTAVTIQAGKRKWARITG
jgi:tyrosyl-tRNA synthetase